MTDIRPPARPVASLAATMPLRANPLPGSQTKRVPKVEPKPRPEPPSNQVVRAPEDPDSLSPSIIQRQIRAFLEAQANEKAAEDKAAYEAKARAKAEAFRKALAAPPP